MLVHCAEHEQGAERSHAFSSLTSGRSYALVSPSPFLTTSAQSADKYRTAGPALCATNMEERKET